MNFAVLALLSRRPKALTNVVAKQKDAERRRLTSVADLLSDWPMQQALIQALMTLVLTCLPAGPACDGTKKDFASCLPADTNLEEVVSAPQAKSANGKAVKQVTVRDKLTSLKAHCKKGKLVAGNGREIRFYRLIGCWGNPPDDYEEQLKRQSEELQRLKKKYTVVEIPCALDPSQIM